MALRSGADLDAGFFATHWQPCTQRIGQKQSPSLDDIYDIRGSVGNGGFTAVRRGDSSHYEESLRHKNDRPKQDPRGPEKLAL